MIHALNDAEGVAMLRAQRPLPQHLHGGMVFGTDPEIALRAGQQVQGQAPASR